MSSDEEKSTSPVLPKDSVQDSSVSSDPQVGKRQYNLIYCRGILFGKGQLQGNLINCTSFLYFTYTGK